MENIIESFESYYDPERDAGNMTAHDMRLLMIIKELIKKTEALAARVEELEEAEDQRSQAEAREFMVELYRV